MEHKRIDRARILRDLRALGVRAGMEIEVHASLSSMGYVEGGASCVLSALRDAVGETGSLFLPALRLSPELPLTEKDRALGIVSKIQILPPDNEKSAMGAIADTFRRQPDVKTGEGVFRVSAWGKSADQVSEGFGYLIDNGGMGLLIGVDIYKLTAMHYAEDLLPERITRIFAPSQAALNAYPPDQYLIESGRPPVMAWYTVQNAALARGMIRKGKIGSAPCMFFALADVVGLYRDMLKSDPCGLYGV